MKKRKTNPIIVLSSICIYLTLLPILNAQETGIFKNENALLWEISGNGLEKPSYLYGTIHIIDSSYFFIEKSVIEKFEESEKIVFEINTNDLEFQQKSILASMMVNDSLKNLLSPDEYKTVDNYFTDTLGIPLNAVSKIKPFFLAELPVLMRLPKTKSYEEEFKEMAFEQHKDILGISTIEKEYEIIDRIDLAIQSKILVNSVAPDIIKEDKTRRNKVMKLYRQQNIDEIFNTMKSAIAEYEIVYTAMFPMRHEVWIPSMENLMEQHSCFFAVGVGHLAGEEGLISILVGNGYSVKPLN